MEYMIKKLTGRFRKLDKPTLEMMCLQLKSLLKSWGAAGPDQLGFKPGDGLPLWAEAEFLDNIVQFELECNPFLHSEITN